MKKAALLVLIAVVLFACNKNKSATNPFSDCRAYPTDSAVIAHAITGMWKLTKQSFPTGEIKAPSKNVKVVFNANQTFQVFENNTVVTEGTWYLEKAFGTYWGLHLSNESLYLNGAIRQCNDELIFTDSFVDGPDNLFKKAQ